MLRYLLYAVLLVGACSNPQSITDIPEWPDGRYNGLDTAGNPQQADIVGLTVESLSINADGMGTSFYDLAISDGAFSGSRDVIGIHAEVSGEWDGLRWECEYRMTGSHSHAEDSFYLEYAQ